MFPNDPDDEAVEAYFARRREVLARVSVATLQRIAVWLPIIDVPANDGITRSYARDD